MGMRLYLLLVNILEECSAVHAFFTSQELVLSTFQISKINSSTEMPHRTSPAGTPRTAARQLKTPGSESDSASVHSATRTPTERSPKLVDRRSPRSPVTEKKRPTSRISELESQLTQLQDDLKKTKEQLSSAESSKRRAQQEAEDTKKQLAAMAAELDQSQHHLVELSAAEDARLSELRHISHERDRAWQSELEAVQKQHSADASALVSAVQEVQRLNHEFSLAVDSKVLHAKQAGEAYSQLHALRQEMNEALDVIQDLKSQLEECKKSEAIAFTKANEALHLKEIANAVNLELEEAGAEVGSLKACITKLECDLLRSQSDHGSDHTLEYEHMRAELKASKAEIEQLRAEAEIVEVRFQEAQINATVQMRSAREAAERVKADAERSSEELNEREAQLLGLLKDLKIELEKSKADVLEMKADLMDKETELQSISEENEGLKSEVEKKREDWNSKAEVDAVKKGKEEALARLEVAIAEAEKNELKAYKIAEELEATKATNASLEAEMRRLRVQTEQWKKAADAAATVLAATHDNGNLVVRSGSMDYSGGRCASPFDEDGDENSPKKKGAVLKKFGDLWRKKSQK
ncbi:interactor of constitutive active ROPs 2, chloroplastic isoform X2 [Amborella trichopoda]|uniref:interactor of constitutive active ROPs 2, chloroplastic isoform X2 n=1 Tax=Amborella trichopoda TaxID=13333 RepID=UPI0009BFF054|nr:interactor of constitutive active ROPs 2, chloroplastic isoform X2 [Amborella trichopoda]|eukprot:XP_020522176.1 interactor of constitutive active ROPs 2, chloroplastic isoform X2 [Amborella trichopoda]